MLSHLAGRLASLVPSVEDWWGEGGPDAEMSDAQTAVDASPPAFLADALAAVSAPQSATEFAPGLASGLASSSAYLPAEIWGEIARFSSRKDILILRSTSTSVKFEADAAISTMTLAGTDALRAFTHARCFSHITTLRLVDIDDASLHDFATHLATHPRHDLTLEIENSYRGVARGLGSLSAVPLAMLRLHNVYLIDSVRAALGKCPFPIALSGYFGAGEFVAATRIPTLRTLISPSTEFDDAVAHLVASHQALQVLSVQASDNLTSRGIADLAQMPALQALSVDQSFFMARPIDAITARALAANRTLERLSIASGIQAPSEETFSFLSESSSLKMLEISVCHGMHRLADITSLERLTLCGSRTGPSVSTDLARVVARMPNLHTLRLHATGFATGALRVLLENCRSENLHLQRVALLREEVAALLANPHVKVLTLVNVIASRELLLPLFQHPTFESLTVDGQ